jgi:hypothetical protein
MTVIDRQNLDKLIDNQDFSASGYFSDFEAEIRTV